jgi:hypothetical protein
MLDAGYSMLDTRCWMLDTGCWMLDIQECSNSEVQKHPVSSIQNQLILAMVFVVTA